MRISVVMINYNYGRYISEAVRSLLLQVRPPDEIVIVDDGSQDESRDRLEQFSSVARVILQEHRGQAAATSDGIRVATGDVIAMLDSDDLARPERLSQIESAYSSHEECQWVFHNVQHIRRDSGEELPTPQSVGFTAGVHDHRQSVGRGRLPITMPPTSGLSWRTDFLKRFMPIPSSIGTQDNYLKFLSLANAPGLVIDSRLSLQGIHDSNIYTGADTTARKRFGLASAVQMAEGLAENGAGALSRRLLIGAYLDSHAGRDLDEGDRHLLGRLIRQQGLALMPALTEATARSVLGRVRTLRSRASGPRQRESL